MADLYILHTNPQWTDTPWWAIVWCGPDRTWRCFPTEDAARAWGESEKRRVEERT